MSTKEKLYRIADYIKDIRKILQFGFDIKTVDQQAVIDEALKALEEWEEGEIHEVRKVFGE